MKLALPTLCLVACTTEVNLGTTVDATPRWAITLGQRGYEQATAVAVDSHGDVLVAGTGSLAAADFGTGTIGDASVHWAFLAKRSGVDGSPIWTIPFAGSGDGNVTSLAVTSNDSVVVTGSGGGTASASMTPTRACSSRSTPRLEPSPGCKPCPVEMG